jgi:hypothetical protein
MIPVAECRYAHVSYRLRRHAGLAEGEGAEKR